MSDNSNEYVQSERNEQQLEELFEQVHQQLEALVSKQDEFDQLTQRVELLADRQRLLQRTVSQGIDRRPNGPPRGPPQQGPKRGRPLGGPRPGSYVPPGERGPMGPTGNRSVVGTQRNGFVPIDVRSYEDEFVVIADLAGFDREDIAIECTDGTMAIRATRSDDDDGERAGSEYVHRERHGTVARTIPLSNTVDTERTTATVENGVLTVHLPKGDENGPTQRIEIE